MFSFVVWKVLFQIIRRLPWYTQFSIIISNQTVFIFTLFWIMNYLMVLFIPKIIYCIITVWNFRSINNLSIFSPDIIILYFKKDSNVSPNHSFNENVKFLTFTDRFFIFTFLNSLFYFFFWIYVSPNININIFFFW